MEFKKIRWPMFVLVVFCWFYISETFFVTDSLLKDKVLAAKQFIFPTDRYVDTNIIIIGIDEQSQEYLGRWPWDRKYLAKMINKLHKGGATVIGLDVLLLEKSNSISDELLVKEVKEAGNVIIPSYIEFEEKKQDNGYRIYSVQHPFSELANVCIPAHINTMPDYDGVVRRTLNGIRTEDLYLQNFALKVYETYQRKMPKEKKKQLHRLYQRENKKTWIQYAGKPETFTKLSFYDVLQDDFDETWFEDAIVLIGPWAQGMQDFYYTPMSRSHAMYGVEIWANIIQNAFNEDVKQEVPTLLELMTLLIIGIISWIGLKKFSPINSFVVLVISVFCYLIGARLLYVGGYIISIAYSVILACVMYASTLVYRYIMEYTERKRVTDIFSRYVAPQVVHKILQEGENALKLGGDKRDITVLFVDIRGFTPLSEKYPPEKVVTILNSYLNACACAIVENGGTLDKFIGDATMAIFNAPLPIEKHALQAVKTACSIKEKVANINETFTKEELEKVEIGIGIHTGEAVVGNVGCHFRMDYTAIGDTVNTAARLESSAKTGEILISEAVYERVKKEIDASSLGEINVKGKIEKIQIYKVEGFK